MGRLLVESTPQVLGPRELQPCGQGVNAGKIFGGHVSDQQIGNGDMISADIMPVSDGPPGIIDGYAARRVLTDNNETTSDAVDWLQTTRLPDQLGFVSVRNTTVTITPMVGLEPS